MRIAGLHVRKSKSKLIITRAKSAKSAKSFKAGKALIKRAARPSARNARGARNPNSGYHLAMLAISAVIVFELIAISSNFSSYGSFSSTGYATAKYQRPSYSVTETYTTAMQSCENVLDSNDPLTAGYVNYIYNNMMGKAADSCVDSGTLLEYSCNVYGQLISEVVDCGYGCLKEGLYGYCA